MKPKILITRKLKSESIAPLYENFDVDMWNSEDEVMPRDQLLDRVKGVNAILCILTDNIDRELLDAAGDQLSVVGTVSVGFDHIDTAELEARNIKLESVVGILNESVADLTIALMINSSRRISESIDAARNGEWSTWSPYWLTGRDLSQSTVGIIGLGAIGETVAKRLSGFGCNVIYNSRSPKPELEQSLGVSYHNLDDLLAESDFVTIHNALTPETEKMCNSEFFSKMKNTAIFINTGRGGLVDQEALYDALSSGQIYAAGIDVTTPEPLPTNHPLFSLKNCTILPHIGSASIRTRDEMVESVVRKLASHL